MSETAKPADMRRGLIDGRHPLEPPDGAEPLEMDGDFPAWWKKKKQRVQIPGKDRWGLDPVPKGWYRGNVDNIVRMTSITPIGELVTYHFDLRGEEGQPRLPVEFVGYTFSKDIRPNLIVETYIGKKFPTGRIKRDRMRLSFDPTNDLLAYNPVKTVFGRLPKEFRNGVLALTIPILVVSFLIWLMKSVFHVF